MYKFNFGVGCPNWADWADLRFGFVHSTDIVEQNQNMFCVWDIIMYQICAAEQNSFLDRHLMNIGNRFMILIPSLILTFTYNY